MKGISSLLIAVIFIALGLTSVVVVYGYVTLAALAVAVPPDYDGEFDDGFLATEGRFYNSFQEGTDCNISNDVLGGSGYISCIYHNKSALDLTLGNNTEYVFSYVVDIDGPVEDMDVEIALKNTGTGKFADDMVIKRCELWTHDDSPVMVADLSTFIEDTNEVDGSTGPLAGDEYVLYTVLQSLALEPVAAAGDDILLIDLDLKTDGDVDSARITVEIA